MQDIDVLIENNKRLVYKQLHKFNLAKDPDAESIGFEALYNAIKNYDSNRGAQLATVATVYIYNALGSYVRTLNAKRQIHTVSYNNYMDKNEEDEFLELLTTGESVEDLYLHKEVCRCAVEAFNKLYDRLTNDRHKVILKNWMESDFSATTTEIAKCVGVSQSYVSQVINKYKYILKKELEDIYYD